MLRAIRTQKRIAVAVTLAGFIFIASQALWAMGPARILPKGQVKVYRGDQLVSILSEEAPLPEGFLLAPEGPCGLRMDNLYLVGDDGSLFSLAAATHARELQVRRGTIYFAMNSASGPMIFQTPDGDLATQRMILMANGEGGLLKGYLDVTPEGTRLGILEGGRLVVLTADGERTIATGRQITLAQADLFDESQESGPAAEEGAPLVPAGSPEEDSENRAGEEEDDDDEIPVAYFIGGGAALAAIGAAIAAGGGGGGGGGVIPLSPAVP
ncbi:MAG: hypothetical protein PVJ53_04200 [Desulfobacterales bacterium]